MAIEDYALLSDCRTAALVSREGSIDWLCLPRLDSASVFAALLGDVDSGCWQLRPQDHTATATRRYEGDTFTLVTRWESADAVAEVRDWMPILDGSEDRSDLVREVVGIRGQMDFEQQVRLRFDYARAVPWAHQTGDGTPELSTVAGKDAAVLRGAALHAPHHHRRGDGHHHVHTGSLQVQEGDSHAMTLTWHPSFRPKPAPLNLAEAAARTTSWWDAWAERIDHHGPHAPQVQRSLLILRALTNRDTGGIAAAATTSLPEDIGGERNWDYRFVWLRDAALTLEALLDHGFTEEAGHWRDWLVRAVAGEPAQAQIVYGIAGERDLQERALASLPGYEGSAPVRIGNSAAEQYQADVVGEVLVTLSAARAAGLAETHRSWAVERALLAHAERVIDQPDNGLWEIRGEPQRFTHSRVMMWAAFDRGVRAVTEFGLSGPVERWRQLRQQLREEIDRRGVRQGFFTQHYATEEVDASLLLLPQVGFCPPDDPRMLATVARIEQTLLQDGLLRRYRTTSGVDGLPGAEHPFLACSFWLVEQYAATGRLEEAHALMNRLLSFCNDVGMLSEEYDPKGGRQIGNTPQAFSHLALVRAADALARAGHRPR